jgi:hypothetical protein
MSKSYFDEFFAALFDHEAKLLIEPAQASLDSPVYTTQRSPQKFCSIKTHRCMLH